MASTQYFQFHFIVLFLIFILPQFTFAQNSGNITLGSSLSATDDSKPWLSPSGDFAFGFRQLEDDNNLFLLSIWYDKLPDKTIVWYANQSNPVARRSTVDLDMDNGFVLRDPQGRILWNTDNFVNKVAYAVLNDTGNLILVRSDSGRIWESFKNPTDTMLPGQTIEIGGMLVSRKTATNFSVGRFYLRMFDDGNLVMNTRSAPSNTDFDDEYYSSATSDPANVNNSGYQLNFSDRGSIAVLRRNGQQVTLTPRSISPASDNYFRATLEFDGVFTQYSHPKTFSGNPGWTVVKSWPDNICININGVKGSGACGYNSACRLDQNNRPICQCPSGFALADPNNAYGDCEPEFQSSCIAGETGSPEDVFELLEVADTDWPMNDYEQLMPSAEEDCKRACLNDCFCAVAIFRNNSCWKKKLPLSNGRIDTTLNVKAFFKFRKGDVPLQRPNISNRDKPRKDQKTLIIVGSALLGSSVFVNCLFITAVCLGFFLIYNKNITKFYPGKDSSSGHLRCFAYKELEQATNGFKEELGRGASGIVYKGVFHIGSDTSTVAIKKLDKVAVDAEKEFRTEVNVIGQTHHKNLVRLLGFCDEGTNRCLVYEYMSNGTLASFLFGDPRPSWNKRTQIALGIARGMLYLHEECGTQIIHCDIKPQNILLDEYYNARVSDFGLAKLLMMNQSRTLTNIRGTKGYVAPEWFRNTQVTAKVDVYSFGVLLLEIVSCRRSLQDLEFGEGENPILVDWVWDCWQEGRLDTLVGNDEEALSDKRRLERFVAVGIWCIQEDSSLRPTMRKISQMLEGIVEVAAPPCPFPYTSTN